MIKNFLKKFTRIPTTKTTVVFKRAFSEQVYEEGSQALGNEQLEWADFGIKRKHRYHNQIFEDLDFELDVRPGLEDLQEMGFGPAAIERLYISYPEFIVADKIGQKTNSVDSVSGFLCGSYGLTQEEALGVIMECPSLLRMENEEILSEVSRVEGLIGGQVEARSILLQCPQVLSISSVDLRRTKDVFNDFIGYSEQEFTALVSIYPELLTIKADNLSNLFIVLIEIGHYTRDQLRSMISTYPGFLFSKPGNVKTILQFLQSQEDHSPNITEGAIEEPRILALDFNSLFHPKIKLLKKFGFSDKEIAEWITFHPTAFAKSLSSTEIKFVYMLRRLKTDINTDKHIPVLMNYNYTTFIRARGEIILKYLGVDEQGSYDWETYMAMNDEQFCLHIGCELSELREIQHAIPFSHEYDSLSRIKIGFSSRSN